MKKILLACFALAMAAPAAQSQLKLTQALINEVVSLINSSGVNVNLSASEIRESLKKGSALGGIKPDWKTADPADFVILIYTNNIAERLFPSAPGVVNENNLAGALYGILLHEAFHKCLKPDATTYSAGVSDPAADYYSCDHLAVDSSAHSKTCDYAADLKVCEEDMTKTAEERTEAHDKRVGACAYADNLEDKWNSDEGKQMANGCLDGSNSPPFSGGPGGNG